MEWTRKHQNLTTVSDNAVFRNSVNKDEHDLPVRKKSKASEGCNSERRLQFNFALKRENVVSKVVSGRRNKPGSTAATQAPRQLATSRCRCQKAEQTAHRLLDRSEGNSRCHENDWNNNNDDATSDKSTYTTSNFIFRDDLSKDEQGLNVRPLFTNSFQWI